LVYNDADEWSQRVESGLAVARQIVNQKRFVSEVQEVMSTLQKTDIHVKRARRLFAARDVLETSSEEVWAQNSKSSKKFSALGGSAQWHSAPATESSLTVCYANVTSYSSSDCSSEAESFKNLVADGKNSTASTTLGLFTIECLNDGDDYRITTIGNSDSNVDPYTLYLESQQSGPYYSSPSDAKRIHARAVDLFMVM